MKRSTKNGEFPSDGQYVLGRIIDRPWLDNSDKDGNRFFVVVRFCRGRPESKIHDGECRFADQHGNNLVPWRWDAFGPGSFFGQEIEEWWDLQEITK